MSTQIQERSYQYYKYYVEIKLHFNSQSFDFFKGHGTRSSPKAFVSRKDRYFFEKIASVFNMQKYLDKLLIAVKEKRNFYIGDIMTPNNEKQYLKTKGYIQAFDQMFEKEMSDVVTYCIKNNITKKEMLNGDDDIKPIIYNLLRKNVVSYETFICLDKMYDITDNLVKFSLDPLVNETVLFVKKYKPFFSKHIPKRNKLQSIICNTLDLIN